MFSLDASFVRFLQIFRPLFAISFHFCISTGIQNTVVREGLQVVWKCLEIFVQSRMCIRFAEALRNQSVFHSVIHNSSKKWETFNVHICRRTERIPFQLFREVFESSSSFSTAYSRNHPQWIQSNKLHNGNIWRHTITYNVSYNLRWVHVARHIFSFERV